jgi:hypothetical protein
MLYWVGRRINIAPGLVGVSDQKMNENNVSSAENQPEQSSGESGASRESKSTASYLWILVAIVAGVIVAWQLVPKVEPMVVTGTEVARESANFLDMSLKEDGSWRLLFSCEQFLEEKCREGFVDGPVHTGQSILAYYYLAEEEGDQSYRQKADRAMDYVLAQCELNNDHCQWNFFPLFVYFMETGDEQYLEGMLNVSETFLEEDSGNAFMNGNMGVKLMMLFEATGESVYSDRLEEMARKILEEDRLGFDSEDFVVYMEGDFEVKSRDVSRIWSAYLPAYKVIGDDVYLIEAEDFFNNADVAKNMSIYRGNYGDLTILKGLESLLDIIDIGESDSEYLDKYRTQAQVIGENLLTRWDTPEHQIFNGDYGFLVEEDFESANKSALRNGWLAQLYLRMGDEMFDIWPI